MAEVDLARIARELRTCGVTHIVWVPDSELGELERHLSSELTLVRACREGEAVAIAAGLLIGGARPVVVCQCTGFFEAGDAFRNVVKDLGLPLFLLISHRNRRAFRAGQTQDSAAQYLEPILQAWGIPYAVLEPGEEAGIIGKLYQHSQREGVAAAVVIAE